MLKPEILDAINKQINAEQYSSYLYLAMAAWLDNENLNGMASWMKVQSREEAGHAMKFYQYLVERGGRITLAAIPAPPVKWESPLAVFEEVCHHESHVTDLINSLVDLARAHKDHATDNFLQWFVKEQVEEESSAADITHKMKMVAKSSNGLFLLDRMLGDRK
jgi:ferritin